MAKKPKVEEFIDDDLCSTKLNDVEIAKYKRLIESKKLPNLCMGGIYGAWGILQEELEKEKVEDAYEISRGKGTKILIINSGIDYEHPEIKGGFLGGFNYHADNDDVSDKEGHGTHIIGIIASKTMGIAPYCGYYAVKVRNDEMSSSPTKYVRKALVEWMDKDIDIINLSLGHTQYNPVIEKECGLALRKNKVIVCAAGKTTVGPTFPASCEGVISVGAVNLSGKHRNSSNIWPTTDISAPGEDIFTTDINKRGNYDIDYALCSGTSTSASHVTAVLSLAISYLKHKKVKLSTKELEALMKSSASPPEYRKEEIEEMIRNYRFDMINNKIEPSQFVRYMYGSGIIRADNFMKEVISFIKAK